MNAENKKKKKKQYEFAAHIRDPEQNPKPDEIEDRRMGIYRDLFYKNIEDFIASGFPVLRQIYEDEQWHEMVRDFIARHRRQSTYFLEIAEEFLAYLQDEFTPRDCDPPFMLELAHYEWVELALMVSTENIQMDGIDPNADLLEGHPVISPLAWPLSYQWPVHELGPDYRPDTPPNQATHIVVFRDRSDAVRFVLINPITARLLYLFKENPGLTGLAAIEQIAQELNHPNLETVIAGGRQALEDLKAQGIILGTQQ